MPKVHTLRARIHFSLVGIQLKTTGNEKFMSGDDILLIGDELKTTGNEKFTMGDDIFQVGNEKFHFGIHLLRLRYSFVSRKKVIFHLRVCHFSKLISLFLFATDVQMKCRVYYAYCLRFCSVKCVIIILVLVFLDEL